MAGLIPFNQGKSNMLRPRGFDDFAEMLDDFFSDSWTPSRSLMRDTFKLDVEDSKDQYIIEADLPGVRREEISLDMSDGRLTISVNREEKEEKEGKNYVHKERRISSMQRSIYLAEADTEGITAKLQDGVLNVTVPKLEKRVTSRKIVIE
jgi:HSP20 family protein